MAMTFGVHAGQQNVSLEELRRLWRFADRSGFDWVSGWDHIDHISNGRMECGPGAGWHEAE